MTSGAYGARPIVAVHIESSLTPAECPVVLRITTVIADPHETFQRLRGA